MSARELQAVLFRAPWYEIRFAAGDSFRSTLRSAVEAELAAHGWWSRWDQPRQCSDGRTTWPLERILIAEGVPA